MQQRLTRPKANHNYVMEPRRSSRARNLVSYRDEVSINVFKLICDLECETKDFYDSKVSFEADSKISIMIKK